MRNNATAWKYWNCKPTGKIMTEKELREKTKHRTFTSLAQRRRWLALHEDIEKAKEKKDKKTKESS